jgi:CheY-like chemotaxis protein
LPSLRAGNAARCGNRFPGRPAGAIGGQGRFGKSIRAKTHMIEPANTILVVEDDRDVRELAIAVLETAGYRVLEAASGDEAHRLLLAHPDLRIDLLFTDIVMPGGLDGIDLANAACALRPELKVLYATGFANLVREHREEELHGSVLAKPYRPGELQRAISALIDETA